MKKSGFILIAIILLLSLGFGWMVYQSSPQNRELPLRETVYETNPGYGYAILLDEKILIKQPYIPTLSGKIPFKTEEDARNTARLIIEKIKKGESPVIHEHELETMGITP